MSEPPRRLSGDDVRRAREVLRAHLPPTPLRRSFALRSRDAYLKLECWQPTGSFKVRGALHILSSLTPAERDRGIVAASAGNHALGVAFAAQALGGRLSATVFVPVTAPRSKVEKLRDFPIDVREVGATYDEAYAAAMRLVRSTGATYVHAYDDPRTAAGQGTVGAEILEQLPGVGAIVVPCGGGGLIAGIAAYVKEVAPSVQIVAVQPEVSPSLRESLRRGEALHEYESGPTVSDGIAGGIGDIVFAHRDLIDQVVEVSEAETEEAMVSLLIDDQVVSEGSGAVGVAAVRSGKVAPPGGRPVAVVVTGGNVDASVLRRLLRDRG
ncbi:MAG: threonine/serine dehydratase [Vicinamibacteria bacterium]